MVWRSQGDLQYLLQLSGVGTRRDEVARLAGPAGA
jgi:hypothetical protein